MMSFLAFQVRLRRFSVLSQKNLEDLFRTRLKEKSFAFVRKLLEHIDSNEISCVHRLRFLTVLTGPGYKTLSERIRCLYNIVVDRLFVAASQPINDHSEHLLCLDTSQLGAIRVPIKHQVYSFASHHKET